MKQYHVFVASVAMTAGIVSGCTPNIENVRGRETVYQDSQSQGAVAGVGIESQDVVGMTDRLVREILATPAIASRNTPPQVIIDSEYFQNQSSQRMNKDIIIARLRTELQRSADGRLIFVARQSADMVARERERKRADQVGAGTTEQARRQLGGDFRLTGQIKSLDTRSSSDGTTERYTQITMELVNLENGQQVWSGLYEFTKAGQEDAVYR